MENSKAYNMLISQINATGSQKLDGYYPNIMEEIYDWERDEVEKIIWETFHRNKDTDLAIFLPKLKNYSGIDALKKMLKECNIPSGNSLNIADVLYRETKEREYLNVIRDNIRADEDNVSAVAQLSYLPPDDDVLKLLEEIYINSNNKTVRSAAVTGILYNKGIIKDINDLNEIQQKINIKRKFILNEKTQREKIIEELENEKLFE